MGSSHIDRAAQYPIRNATEWAVLVALAWHSDENGQCEPSQAEIAQLIKCNIRTVQRITKRLEQMGAITRKRRRQGTIDEEGFPKDSLLYTLNLKPQLYVVQRNNS